MRYVLTAFAYGCGPGPTQASRHLDVPIPEHVLRFINRCHVPWQGFYILVFDRGYVSGPFSLRRVISGSYANGVTISSIAAANHRLYPFNCNGGTHFKLSRLALAWTLSDAILVLPVGILF